VSGAAVESATTVDQLVAVPVGRPVAAVRPRAAASQRFVADAVTVVPETVTFLKSGGVPAFARVTADVVVVAAALVAPRTVMR
jgi:hypothetical protein